MQASSTEQAPPTTQAPPEVATTATTADEAADEVNSSLPAKTQLKFQPAYTFPHGDRGYVAELQFQPTLPYHGFLIPELEVASFWSLARIQLSALSEQHGQDVASGLGDLTLTDLVARDFGSLRAGVGFATVFPMATDSTLGKEKWQLGPAAGLQFEGVPHLRLAVLVQNFYSVAGSNQSPSLAYVTVQPFITVHLPAACFVSTDATMDFYWKGGKTNVPVDIGFGHAFGPHFVGTLQGWYTVAGDHQGDIKARAVLSFLP